MHLGHRHVRVFQDVLPVVRKSGHRCSVYHSVIAPEAQSHEFLIVQAPIIEDWTAHCSSDGHDAYLGEHDQRACRYPCDCSDVRQADCSPLKVLRTQPSLLRKGLELIDFSLDVEHTQVLHILNIGGNQAIGGVNSQADIVVGMSLKLKLPFRLVIGGVHPRVTKQSQRESLGKQAHHSHSDLLLFELVSDVVQLGHIDLLMQVQVGHSIGSSHRLLHALLICVHLYSLGLGHSVRHPAGNYILMLLYFLSLVSKF